MLTTCAICRTDFEPPSREHVLPNALGWAFATVNIVCAECNQRTAPADAALCESFRTLTTIVNPVARRTPPPRVRVEDVDAPLSLEPGGRTHLPPIYPIAREGDDTWLSISEEALSEFEERMAKDGRRLEQTARSHQSYFPNVRLPVFTMEASHTVLPSLLKAALHWASHQVLDWDRTGDGAEAIRQILLGNRDSIPWQLVAWDYDQPDMDASPFYHGVQVGACPETATIVARVHVYGLLRIRCVLSSTYAGCQHEGRIRTTDPTTGNDSCSPISCGHPVPWLYGLTRREFPHDRAVDYFKRHRDVIRPPGFEDLMQDG